MGNKSSAYWSIKSENKERRGRGDRVGLKEARDANVHYQLHARVVAAVNSNWSPPQLATNALLQQFQVHHVIGEAKIVYSMV